MVGVSLYSGEKICLASMHKKENYLAPACKKILGAVLEELGPKINTDLLGTFSGEIDRAMGQKETALKKCRLGLEISGLKIGVASEGSFSSNFLGGVFSTETVVFVDKGRGIEISETMSFRETNFQGTTLREMDSIHDFLKSVMFPSHALIARPNIWEDKSIVFKGIQDIAQLKKAFLCCLQNSPDRSVYLETDMRAHMNPTRGLTIRKLGIRLFRRLSRQCPICEAPGWGVTEINFGRECASCLLPTRFPLSRKWLCCSCFYEANHPVWDAKVRVDPRFCEYCNP